MHPGTATHCTAPHHLGRTSTYPLVLSPSLPPFLPSFPLHYFTFLSPTHPRHRHHLSSNPALHALPACPSAYRLSLLSPLPSPSSLPCPALPCPSLPCSVLPYPYSALAPSPIRLREHASGAVEVRSARHASRRGVVARDHTYKAFRLKGAGVCVCACTSDASWR
ncbi:unnamed protein product [Taenia asiatica]|uniref:Uncharacterized protein n=1 Tax=Taenia asiatica TaxID=60517 RepID=A0A0R3VY97_TAEAS|nr:unnamed protein product [Taenia asiatica]